MWYSLAPMQEDLALSLIVSDEAHLRLDKLLSTQFPQYSRAYFQFLLEQGAVLVNGKRGKKSEKMRLGDQIELCLIMTPEMKLEPQEIALDILYEDEHLIAVNKPAGMLVHPAPGYPRDTFASALLFHCHTLPGSGTLRPGIVHRLDKDTSGVLLGAKTLQAHGKLIALFSERRIEKHYVALCVGTPREGVIEAPLHRHPVRRQEMCVDREKGKEAKSLCQVVQKNEQLSFVKVQIFTGRTHQIRVHLKFVGAPVLGDKVYGVERANHKFNAPRQLLHAHRVCLAHPLTQEPLVLTAPLPKDFLFFMDKVGFDRV